MHKRKPRPAMVSNLDTERDKAALADARRLLAKLDYGIVSWNERTDTSGPEKKLRAAVALVENSLTEAEKTLAVFERFLRRRRNGKPNKAADALLFVRLARQKAVPELQQARPRLDKRPHRYRKAARDESIAPTVELIRERYGYSLDKAATIVSEALQGNPNKDTTIKIARRYRV
jgi:hypothetical protein